MWFLLVVIAGIVWMVVHQLNEHEREAALRRAKFDEILRNHNERTEEILDRIYAERARARQRRSREQTYAHLKPQVRVYPVLDPTARRRRISQLHPDKLGREQTKAERAEYTRLTRN